jgi:hypothetical protein
MANSIEMGVSIDRSDPADGQLFKDAMGEIGFIQAKSQTFDFVAQQFGPPRPSDAPSCGPRPCWTRPSEARARGTTTAAPQ